MYFPHEKCSLLETCKYIDLHHGKNEYIQANVTVFVAIYWTVGVYQKL